MATWPTGHRWEDYDLSILDVDRNRLDSLHSVQNLRYDRAHFGQFSCKLTFSLDARDPWATVLRERENHYIAINRDGERVFSGYQVKIDRSDVAGSLEQWIDFQFMPLSRTLGWRIGALDEEGLTRTGLVDDAIKWMVRRTHGALSSNTPTSGLPRQMPGFIIAADKSESPDNVLLLANGQDMYEFVQQTCKRYQVDFDVYFDDNYDMVFQTWWPRRGVDHTEGNPARRAIIFTDEQGSFTKQQYGTDTSDLKTVAYDRLATKDQAAGATRRDSFGLREFVVNSGDDVEIGVGLEGRDLQEFYKLSDYVEQESQQWRVHWKVGDEITWNSIRMGYGPHNATVSKVTAEIDREGYEHLTPTFGYEPDVLDKMRGGGKGRDDPGYTAPTIWHIYGDTPTNLDPDDANAIGVVGDGATIASTEVAATNRIVLETIPAGFPFVPPKITFSDAAIEGIADSVIRSDATLLLQIRTPGPIDVPPVFGADPGNAWSFVNGVNINITGVNATGVITFGTTGPAAATFVAPAFTYGAGNVIGASGNVVHSDSVLALGITCDDANTVYPDAADNNEWDVIGGTGCQTVGAVANTVKIDTVWVRADLRTGGGGQTGLYPTDMAGGYGEAVVIGSAVGTTDEGAWVNVFLDTKLDVLGHIRVGRALYATNNSVAIWGISAARGTVHILDGTLAVDGAGGSACILDVFDGNTPRIKLDADNANPSFVQTFFEIQDAAAAIAHTFNATTGVVTLNAQRLAAGDFSVLAQAAGVTILGTDANTRNLILNNVTHLWPAVDAAGALISNGAGVLSWGAPVPAAHNLLSAQHGDTVASAMTRGDLVVGTAGGWDDLPIGAINTHLESDGVDAAWVLPDIYGAPATCTVATANVAGIAHTHAIMSTFSPGVAASLLSTSAAGELAITGSLYIAAAIRHIGDITTLTSFSPGQWYVDIVGVDAIRCTGTAVIINDDGVAARDLIVESQGQARQFVVDGGTNQVGMNNVLYTWPAANAAGSLNNNGAGVLTWGAPAPAAHNLLSASHGDTVASAVGVGDLVIGTAGGWDDLGIGAVNTHLESDGATAAWVLPDIYGAPATCTVATANVAGIAHTHAITSSSSPGAAASILATNGAGSIGITGFLDVASNIRHIGDLTTMMRFTPGFWQVQVTGATRMIMSATETSYYAGQDQVMYSDAGVTEEGRWDGATGNIQIGWGNAAGRMSIVDANTYIDRGGVFLDVATDLVAIILSPGGGAEVACSQGFFSPFDTGVTSLGQLPATTKRWSNVVSVLGNYIGTITCTVAATSIDATGIIDTDSHFISRIAIGTAPYQCTSTTLNTNLNADRLEGFHGAQAATANNVVIRSGNNILMAALGEVDGVDISIHTHNYDEVGDQAATTYAGLTTSSWELSLPAEDPDGITVHDNAGVNRYIRIADNAAGLNARWEFMFISSVGHIHYILATAQPTGVPN